MLDPKRYRQELDSVAQLLAKKGFSLDKYAFEMLETQRKSLQVETEQLQSQRKSFSKQVGQLKAAGESADSVLSEVAAIGQRLDNAEQHLKVLQAKLLDWSLNVPNIPHDSVPDGKTEEDNIEVRCVGEIPTFDFTVKDHIELAEGLSGLDFEAAARMSGARFAVLKGPVARLHRALIQFMLHCHTRLHGYEEVYVPYLVQADALRGTGQLPKFEEDLFKVSGDKELYLIPTAEVPVTNLYQDQIVEVANLPIKLTTHTPCFRSEAGSYGRDTRGFFRQHQFEKVEMVQFVRPEVSYEALEELVGHAEAILQALELPYRVVNLCGGDLGFSAAKTYDLEVWLPGQQAFREVSSCSNFEDFQARRAQIRYRNPMMKKPELLHTLNGSGLAAGRTLIALLENHQLSDGRIRVPKALQPFLDGAEVL